MIPDVLLAVLAAPPAGTSGERTRRRVQLAATLIGCQHVVIANLFDQPVRDVQELTIAGADPNSWIGARYQLGHAITMAQHVLMAWGISEPTGSAREHHRAQIDWVTESLSRTPSNSWMLGDGPRHPSRWQRYTSRIHPGLPFTEAVRMSLQHAPPPMSRQPSHAQRVIRANQLDR